MAAKHVGGLGLGFLLHRSSNPFSLLCIERLNASSRHVPSSRLSSTTASPGMDQEASRTTKPWTILDIQRLQKLYQQNLSERAIATELGKSPQMVGYHLRRLHAGFRMPKIVSNSIQKPWSDEELAQLRNMTERGLSYAIIAKHLGRSRLSVIGKHRMTSPEGRKTGFWSSDEHQQYLCMKQRGETNANIAAALNRTLNSIRSRNERFFTLKCTPAFTDRRWTERDVALLLELQHAGKSVEEMLSTFPTRTAKGITMKLACLKGNGCNSPRRAKGFWTSQEVERLRQLCLAGTPVNQISARLGRSMKAVYTKLREAGIRLRERDASSLCRRGQNLNYAGREKHKERVSTATVELPPA